MTAITEILTAIQAGGCDWLAIWQQMVDAERAQTAARIGMHTEQRADRWAGRSGRFAQAVGRVAQPDAFIQALLPQLRPTDTVLDIGAGTGRHSAFLASQVAQVMAVEPSASMRRHLEQLLSNAEARNVTVIADPWPCFDRVSCDIAICAHVVYGVREIGPFLTQMSQVARRACFLLVGFRQPSYVLSPFWEALYGEPRLPLPGALECLNVLYQLGIAAQLTLLPASRYVFANHQEALDDLRWRLSLPDDTANTTRITSAIQRLLQPDDTGGLAVPGQPSTAALLYWKTSQSEKDRLDNNPHMYPER